jgi:hypothetical protein
MSIVFEQSNPKWNCPPIPEGVYRLSSAQPVAIDNGRLQVSVIGLDLNEWYQCRVVKVNERKVLWSCGTLQVTNISNKPITVKVTNHRQFAPGDRSINVKNCLSEVAEAIPGTEEKRTIQPGETVSFDHPEFEQLPQLQGLPREQTDAVSVLEVESFPWLWVIGLATAGGLATYLIVRRR